ncbi:transmembrane protein, putative [Medicago truncatula]|uniref:Transmembrane protein, putative n=1 Tax=Medicago truncatula TaxID=3880 RepID=A0A072VEJ9_MEDTR|nr:transmembrane protein, putative [Medicago truncatula]
MAVYIKGRREYKLLQLASTTFNKIAAVHIMTLWKLWTPLEPIYRSDIINASSTDRRQVKRESDGVVLAIAEICKESRFKRLTADNIILVISWCFISTIHMGTSIFKGKITGIMSTKSWNNKVGGGWYP